MELASYWGRQNGSRYDVNPASKIPLFTSNDKLKKGTSRALLPNPGSIQWQAREPILSANITLTLA